MSAEAGAAGRVETTAPAPTKMSNSPSCMASSQICWWRDDDAAHALRNLYGPSGISAAARRSSSRPLVQEPMTA